MMPLTGHRACSLLCLTVGHTPFINFSLGTPGPVPKCCWMAAFLEAAFLAELLWERSASLCLPPSSFRVHTKVSFTVTDQVCFGVTDHPAQTSGPDPRQSGKHVLDEQNGWKHGLWPERIWFFFAEKTVHRIQLCCLYGNTGTVSGRCNK